MSGLTRVRKFHQDDAHIFCAAADVRSEMIASLDFLTTFYKRLGFERFYFTLSTRPSDGSRLGSDELWNTAEASLKEALNEVVGSSWTVREGEGAFYGPKIDVMIEDAIQRQVSSAEQWAKKNRLSFASILFDSLPFFWS